MTHAIDCPACGGHLKIPDGIWDKRVQGQVAHLNCKKCKHPIEVDGRSEEQKAVALQPPAVPAKPAPAPAPEAPAAEPPKAEASPPKLEPAEGSKPDNPKPIVSKLELQPRRPELRPKLEIAPKVGLRGARADVTPRPLDTRGPRTEISAKLPDVAPKPDRGSKPEIASKPDRGSKPDITAKPDRGSKPDITAKPAEITAKLPEVAVKADALAPKPVEARALGRPAVPKLGPPPERHTKPELSKPALRESTPDTPRAKLGIKSDPPPASIPADSSDIIELPPSEPLPRFPPPKPADARKTLPDREPPPKPATSGKKPPPKPDVIRESDVGEPSPPKKSSQRPKANSERPKASEEKRRSVRPVALDSKAPNTPVLAAETPSARKGRGLTIVLIVAAAVAVGWWVLRPRAQAPAQPQSSPPATASVAPSATATPPPPPTREPSAENSPTPPPVEPAIGSASADEPKKEPPKKRRSVTPTGTRYVPSSI